MNELQRINKEIDDINKDIPVPRVFVINNEEKFISTMFMRTNGLSLSFINNFCIEFGLTYDSNNQQIMLIQTQIKI